MKKNWMIWTIIILGLLNISTLGTIFYHQYKSDKNIENISAPESRGGKFSGRFFRDRLHLSDEQMNQFSDFNPEFRQDARKINEDLTSLRKEMLFEMTSPSPDSIKINSIADSIGMVHSNLKKITFRYYMNFRKICTTEQQEQLEQIFSDLFAIESVQGITGNGKQFGRRRNQN